MPGGGERLHRRIHSEEAQDQIPRRNFGTIDPIQMDRYQIKGRINLAFSFPSGNVQKMSKHFDQFHGEKSINKEPNPMEKLANIILTSEGYGSHSFDFIVKLYVKIRFLIELNI